MTGRLCCVCVLDDSMPGTALDENGQCRACAQAIARKPFEWHNDSIGLGMLDSHISRVKCDAMSKSYDCIIGLSGGLDSAYLAMFLRKRYPDLRMLAIHVDGGWNSEPAVRNIESLVKSLDLDLQTNVIEWSEMQDLQRAFLRSGVLNQDIPQDHAFFASLYHTAAKYGIHWFLSGLNFSSESVNPTWSFPAIDLRHLMAIHQRYGEQPLATFPKFTLAQLITRKYLLKSLNILAPLNYTNYDRSVAVEELRKSVGWRDYGEKHCESRWTKFYQEIYLPRKHGFDKRRMHYSSLIVSGQMSREAALVHLESPPCDPKKELHDIRYIAKKLNMPIDELEEIISEPPVDHFAYANNQILFSGFAQLKKRMRKLKSIFDGRAF
jgi:N-acetyl sugar amidotransferase